MAKGVVVENGSVKVRGMDEEWHWVRKYFKDKGYCYEAAIDGLKSMLGTEVEFTEPWSWGWTDGIFHASRCFVHDGVSRCLYVAWRRYHELAWRVL